MKSTREAVIKDEMPSKNVIVLKWTDSPTRNINNETRVAYDGDTVEREIPLNKNAHTEFLQRIIRITMHTYFLF